MTDYLRPRVYTALKSQLTRAINSKDPYKVVMTCRTARRMFEAYTYPDDWTRWTRALDDFNNVHLYSAEAVNRVAREAELWQK